MRGLIATFRRGRGHDQIAVVRSDATQLSWRFPTYGGTVPHDLIHLVVEAGFGLREAFWGLVDAGADPAHINAAAARLERDRFSGFGENRRELLMAEGLAAVHWFDTAIEDADLCDVIAERCASFEVEAPTTTNPERVAAVRAAITVVRARWRRCAPNGQLALGFCVDDPEATLDEVLLKHSECG